MTGPQTANLATVSSFYRDLWEAADYPVLERIMTPAVTFQGTFGQVMHGRDAFAAYVHSVRDAFSAYRCAVVDLIAEQDRVAARVRFSGRHDVGPFLGVAPTGRELAWEGVGFFRLEQGLIADLWVMGDMLGLRRQLEA